MNRKSNIPKTKIDKGWKNMQVQLDIVMPAKPQSKRRPLVWWWRAAAVAILAVVAIGLSQPDILLKKQQNDEVNTQKAPKLHAPSVSEKRNLLPTQLAPLNNCIPESFVEEKREKGAVGSHAQTTAAPAYAVSPANAQTYAIAHSAGAPTTPSSMLERTAIIAENKLTLIESTAQAPQQPLLALEKLSQTIAPIESVKTLPLVDINNDFPKLAIATEAPTRIASRENFKFGIVAELDMAADKRINGYHAAFVLDLFTHKRLGLRSGVGFRQIQFENNRNLVIPVTADDLFGYTSNMELLEAFDTQPFTTSSTASRNNALPYVRRLTRIELPVYLRYAFGSRWTVTTGINTVYTFDITAKSGELSFLNSFDQNTEKVADNAFNRIASNRYEVWTLDYSLGLEYRVHRNFNIGVNWQQSIGENDTFKNNKRLNIVGLRGTYFFD